MELSNINSDSIAIRNNLIAIHRRRVLHRTKALISGFNKAHVLRGIRRSIAKWRAGGDLV